MHTRVIAVCAAVAALAVGTAGAARSASAAEGQASPAKAAALYGDVRGILQRLATTDGAPGALAEVSDAHGRTVLTSGVADAATGAPVAADSRFRIGSMTKMFWRILPCSRPGPGGATRTPTTCSPGCSSRR